MGMLKKLRNVFKSKSTKQAEREFAIRKAITYLNRQIGILKKNELGYLDKAREALRLKSQEQLEFLKKTLTKTIAQRRQLERELLHVQTLQQVTDQMKGHSEFVSALSSLGDNLAASFKDVDTTAMQTKLQKAMIKAEDVSQRMDSVLDYLSDTMFAINNVYGDGLISDEEVDRMIAGAEPDRAKLVTPLSAAEPRSSERPSQPATDSFDDQVLKLIREIERELHKEK